MHKPAPPCDAALATRAVDTIKFLAIDGIEAANSGHPGLPMGAADYAFILWSRYLKYDPRDPHWPDRDRFILSAGHGSMLLYALLHLAGYDLPMDELRRFRQWDSKTPGHPEAHLTPGVECTTGPLGQGFANGVGMALAAKMAEARYPGLYDHRIWGIVSDGDIMEGVAAEAASLAGHLGLGNLTYIYDDNKITLDGRLSESMSEDVAKRFEAYGWRTLHIDGHDHAQIAAAFDEAIRETERPMLILARTVIGHGAATKFDTHKVHGEPLGKEETRATKEKRGWPVDQPFWVPDEVRALWAERAKQLGEVHAEWREKERAWLEANPERAKDYLATRERRVPPAAELAAELAKAAPTKGDATRGLAGAVMQRAAQLVPSLVGGDADLGGSTKTPIKDSGKVLRGQYEGRNLRFGIREHAMGAMANGMALYGHFIPFTATFLTFSDYMRPSIRLAALTHTQVVHVFTHDSILLGEDGPTHQAVEHVAALRLIPNVDVWRPSDAHECAAAWAAALERKDGPTELILSRQKVADPPAPSNVNDALRGGYVVVREQGGAPEVIFLATGSEVGVAVEAARLLAADGRRVRVVSLPCLEVFARQDAAWRESVLPSTGVRVSIEAGRTDCWRGWVGPNGLAIGVDTFGASAPYQVLAEKYGLTPAQVADRVRAHLSR
jgi:transketolase